MKREDLILSDNEKLDRWLKRCLPIEDWQEGKEETAAILERANTSEQFVYMILNSDTMRGTQIYAELSKSRPGHRERLERTIGGWYETYSAAGGLKIKSGMSVIIPNGHGDGKMWFTVVDKDCFNDGMLDFWTTVEGHEIDVYDYDCSGGNIIRTLDGRFGVYYGYGYVLFERWGDAE